MRIYLKAGRKSGCWWADIAHFTVFLSSEVFVKWPAELWTCSRTSCVNLIIWQHTTTAEPYSPATLKYDSSVLPWPGSVRHVWVSVCSSAASQASSSLSGSRNIPSPLYFQGIGPTVVYSWTSSLKGWKKEGSRRV